MKYVIHIHIIVFIYIIHILWPISYEKERWEKGHNGIHHGNVCVFFSFQDYHVLNLCSNSLSESSLFLALIQAAFIIVELEMLSHLGMVSTMSVKWQRGKVRPTAKTTFPGEIWCWPRNNTEQPEQHCYMQYNFNRKNDLVVSVHIHSLLCLLLSWCVCLLKRFK